MPASDGVSASLPVPYIGAVRADRGLPPRIEHQIVIVGAGTAGITTAAVLLLRERGLDIALIEPKRVHYYQPGWTLVGAGLYPHSKTERSIEEVMPEGAVLIEGEVCRFEPRHDQLVLRDGRTVSYAVLILAMGIELDWAAIPGLTETLGQNGVASSYDFDAAPYVWDLIQELGSGRALFTQPRMPIKCSGAPQKIMYLASDFWRGEGKLGTIEVEFHTPGAALTANRDFLPELSHYVGRYGISPHLGSCLIAVDGPSGQATFEKLTADGKVRQEVRHFDLLHVVPPQRAPQALRESELSNGEGWAAVDPETLQHVGFPNVFALGDCCSAPNEKTAAAVRAQAPVLAENLIAYLGAGVLKPAYDGYGACPVTVARGRVLLAQFGYRGRLLPPFPRSPNKAIKATRLGWFLDRYLFPKTYWTGLLKGRGGWPRGKPYVGPTAKEP
jgi:sulfide:quinone oxidoreductase|tara:strand:+ start:18034 stop:19365 length:1332 start_codon:yes stop_codon:yes gene_type:complete